MTYKHLPLFIVLFISLAGCSVFDHPDPTSAPSRREGMNPADTLAVISTPQDAATVSGDQEQARTSPTPSSLKIVEEDQVVIIGEVEGIMLSAREIVLKEPSRGIRNVALTQETVLISAEGEKIEILRDFPVDVKIRAIGREGAPGALIAEEIYVLPQGSMRDQLTLFCRVLFYVYSN